MSVAPPGLPCLPAPSWCLTISSCFLSFPFQSFLFSVCYSPTQTFQGSVSPTDKCKRVVWLSRPAQFSTDFLLSLFTASLQMPLCTNHSPLPRTTGHRASRPQTVQQTEVHPRPGLSKHTHPLRLPLQTSHFPVNCLPYLSETAVGTLWAAYNHCTVSWC